MTTTPQNNLPWPYVYFIKTKFGEFNHYHGTRHGSPFRSEKHAKTVLKYKFTSPEAVIAKFILVPVE